MTGADRVTLELIAIGAIDDDARAELEAALAAAGARVIGAVDFDGATGPGRRWAIVDGAAAPRARAIELRRAADAALAGRAIDLAVRAAGPRPPVGLAVFDMDSTLIPIEVIDELARAHGVGAQVAAVTERAMRGELDFEASLRARVAALRGLPATAADELAARLALSPGAERLIEALHARGAAVAIASGGFTFAASTLQRRLGLAHVHANTLEIAEGALTGAVVGPVVTAERKAALVVELAAAAGLPLAATLAIGDGANDRLMLAQAGFGVAFRAKPALRATADATVDHAGLDRVLDFLDAPPARG